MTRETVVAGRRANAPGRGHSCVRGATVAKGTCDVVGCERRAEKRQWCSAHYQRWRTFGDPLGSATKPSREQRFWAKVDKQAQPCEYAPSLGPCWLWTAGLNDSGYGIFGEDARPRRAHRIAYEMRVGPIPKGLVLDHLCRTPACVNPQHLEPVTHRINNLRGISPAAANAHKTHCIRGHGFTPENTYVQRNGKRQCRICIEIRRLRRRYSLQPDIIRGDEVLICTRDPQPAP